MSPLRAAGLALVAVLAVAGCGSDDDGGAIVDGDTSVSSPPATGDGDDDGGVELVEPTPGLDAVTIAAIDSVALIDPTTLEVHFYNGVEPCYGVDHVTVVDDTADAVSIEVGVGSNPDAAGVACIELAQLQGVQITLDAPLGERSVIDASTGQAVPAIPAD